MAAPLSGWRRQGHRGREIWSRGADDNELSSPLDHLSLGRTHLLAVQRGAASDLGQATSHIQQAVDGLRRAGQQDYLPLGLLARAALHTHNRAFGLARHDLDEVLTLSTRCGFRLHEADAHLGYARLCLAEERSADAREHLAKARKIIGETGYHRRDGELAELEALSLQQEGEIKRKDAKAQGRKKAGESESLFAPLRPGAFALNSPPDSVTATPEPIIVAPPARSEVQEPEPMPHDIAIICALRTPELEKVFATGKQPWEKLPRDADDPTGYRTTTFATPKGTTLSVIAAAPNQMGMPASAVLATKMVRRFRPKIVAMVGIAAGVKTEAQGFGDVLAPETTLDYGAGKISAADGKLHLSPDPNPINISPILRERLKEWALEHDRLACVRQQWQAKKPNSVLQIHVGPLGSGAAVVTARETVKAAQEHWRKLIGIEMEAYGVHLACQEAVNPPPMFLCMKSICDFAGPDKGDDWQDYAAYTAAQLCHLFLTEEWDTLFPR